VSPTHVDATGNSTRHAIAVNSRDLSENRITA